ncbi:MAG: SMC-Scp complex subunit ScpB [Candidatus Nealsonbacteria bacterium]|nr:SMC-Scp complex subunit ScpB [Candidatus Nealsonbacteria bacterium]
MANGCPYRAVREGGGYRLALHKAFHGLRNRFYGRVREARLSQAAVDVLALVAYHQPVDSEQISRMRGKPGSHVLSQLVRRGLLRIERPDPTRRTATYWTTDRFLELFSLETLEDLPQSEDLQRQ